LGLGFFLPGVTRPGQENTTMDRVKINIQSEAGIALAFGEEN